MQVTLPEQQRVSKGYEPTNLVPVSYPQKSAIQCISYQLVHKGYEAIRVGSLYGNETPQEGLGCIAGCSGLVRPVRASLRGRERH